MPTSWKRADDNALRVHLQEALAQRAATPDAADWSYSDYEVAAIRAELNERQLAHAALRTRAHVSEASASQPETEPPSPGDPDAARLRVLLARCFKPARRRPAQRLHGESAFDGDVPSHRQHGDRNVPLRVFARLQRLR